jgi:KEOPS complex subunit Pcc1
VAHETVLTFSYDSAVAAKRVERSLLPEIDDIDDDRSQMSIDRSASTLKVTIQAADLVALRAAMNTWLSLVDVAESAGRVE